jgi:hypothetical protein
MAREALIAECKRRYANGEDIEKIIAFLRASGCSKIDTIAVLKSACDIGLGEGKKLAHFSPTWGDSRDSDENFHETLVDAASAKKPK